MGTFGRALKINGGKTAKPKEVSMKKFYWRSRWGFALGRGAAVAHNRAKEEGPRSGVGDKRAQEIIDTERKMEVQIDRRARKVRIGRGL